MITQDNLETYYVRIGRLKQRYLPERFEQDLPVFRSRSEAAEWFSSLFNENFVFVEVMEAAGTEQYYQYDIIHDREIWERRQRDIREKGTASGPGMLLCAQRVDIHEDGSVHLAV
ncbi:hypothetical protein R70723_17435 [Paenibacillus sp. FSL R7-0273]|uniref:hypothetical protein n=1 Tax=Paenibacillus sp. FSL R7-0273 TaxID=1536772 RepID=UPI0004F8347C|nr:hypothetical protein [Paenibacillus sp. FSL R7-0273]AIQ47468.1 hypothetical protein R70723_17435 [Paenibacillus sp. FSL R7-0273]OMF95970.1 hypothetical protein BK144_05145 [Paenibacillus sp. FSL R7-0273]